MERFTIIDYLERMNEKNPPEETPYEWTEEDSAEFVEGNYLTTPESFERVIRRIAEQGGLDTRSRKRVLVDRRKFLLDVAVNKGGLTLSKAGQIFNRDHSTTLFSIRQIKHINRDPNFIQNCSDLIEFFKNVNPIKRRR